MSEKCRSSGSCNKDVQTCSNLLQGLDSDITDMIYVGALYSQENVFHDPWTAQEICILVLQMTDSTSVGRKHVPIPACSRTCHVPDEALQRFLDYNLNMCLKISSQVRWVCKNSGTVHMGRYPACYPLKTPKQFDSGSAAAAPQGCAAGSTGSAVRWCCRAGSAAQRVVGSTGHSPVSLQCLRTRQWRWPCASDSKRK